MWPRKYGSHYMGWMSNTSGPLVSWPLEIIHDFISHIYNLDIMEKHNFVQNHDHRWNYFIVL